MKEPWKRWVKPKRLNKYKNGELPATILQAIPTGRLTLKAQLYRPAAVAFTKMFEAAKRDGITLKSTGKQYRGIAGQISLFRARYAPKPTGRVPQVTRRWDGKTWYLRKGSSPAATPARSVHGWGCAVDLDVRDRKVYEWLCTAAPCFGFYLQGPRTLANGKPNPEWEPWHWEWSGRD